MLQVQGFIDVTCPDLLRRDSLTEPNRIELLTDVELGSLKRRGGFALANGADFALDRAK